MLTLGETGPWGGGYSGTLYHLYKFSVNAVLFQNKGVCVCVCVYKHHRQGLGPPSGVSLATSLCTALHPLEYGGAIGDSYKAYPDSVTSPSRVAWPRALFA